MKKNIPKGKINRDKEKEKLNYSLENSKDKKGNFSSSTFKLNITPIKSYPKRDLSKNKRSGSINSAKSGLPPMSGKKKN